MVILVLGGVYYFKAVELYELKDNIKGGMATFILVTSEPDLAKFVANYFSSHDCNYSSIYIYIPTPKI